MNGHEGDVLEEYQRVATVRVFHAPALVLLVCVGFVGLLSSCDYMPTTGADAGFSVTTSPSLSPSGEYLVYASMCTGRGDIYLMKSGASDSVRLTHSEDFESSPMFTADGERIVFAREHAGRRHVWIMDADGANVRQLSQGNVLDDPKCLSRDGGYLLFTRSKPSFGLGRVVHKYLMRIDEGTDKIIDVGDVAVMSPDSRLVVYSDTGELWRLELDGKEVTRRRIRGTGWPVDTSADGKLILVVRRPTGKAWIGDDEIWVLDTDRKSEKKLAIGHSAVLFGIKRENVLFFSGKDQMPYVTTIDGGAPKRIQCPPTYKTHPRVCWDGSGAVIASFARHSRWPEYKVIFIDFEQLRATTIASVACGGSTFKAPSKKMTE